MGNRGRGKLPFLAFGMYIGKEFSKLSALNLHPCMRLWGGFLSGSFESATIIWAYRKQWGALIIVSYFKFRNT